MPPTTRTYYRNYDSSDTTSVAYGGTASTFAYLSDLGWTAPSGKRFKEWNRKNDGTDGAYAEGEDTGESHESVYTVYAIWEDIIPYLVTDEELVSVADAIREKGGTSAQLEWPDEYIEAIGDIQTGGGEHGIYSDIRDHIDAPTTANTGDTVTMTLTSTDGFTIVNNITTGTQLSGANIGDVDVWSMGPSKTQPAPSVGDTRSFTMPDSDIIIRLFS